MITTSSRSNNTSSRIIVVSQHLISPIGHMTSSRNLRMTGEVLHSRQAKEVLLEKVFVFLLYRQI